MLTQSLFHLVGDHVDQFLEFHQGVEKEGLRVLSNMHTSKGPHPEALGHKLTHPYITTDYAENLLEFVSPVFVSNERLMDFLAGIQAHALRGMPSDEHIWPSSMPALLPEDKDIPIADFGKSNVGKLKSLYRIGLGNRYGRSMQSIAGMHFNFSLSRNLLEKLNQALSPELDIKDFTDQAYFKLIRNFRRYSWLLSYLFGASPVVDENFLKGKKHSLEKIGKDTFGREYATSLRMGGLGYTSAAQNEISVCYNRLSTYVATLESARKRPYPAYERIGVKVDGEYRQLNANLLQIDNEFYSTLRPKRTAKSGESALQALHQHGVEYVEVRLLDLNPFVPEGISDEGIRFLQLFLTYCLLEESPQIPHEECEEISHNFDAVVNEGRNPKTLLREKGRTITVKDFAQELLEKMERLFDLSPELKSYYRDSFDAQVAKTQNTEKLLSSRVMESVNAQVSFVQATLELAKDHKEHLLNRSVVEKDEAKLSALALGSIRQEKELVQSDTGDFDTFLRNYFEKINIKEYP